MALCSEGLSHEKTNKQTKQKKRQHHNDPRASSTNNAKAKHLVVNLVYTQNNRDYSRLQ